MHTAQTEWREHEFRPRTIPKQRDHIEEPDRPNSAALQVRPPSGLKSKRNVGSRHSDRSTRKCPRQMHAEIFQRRHPGRMRQVKSPFAKAHSLATDRTRTRRCLFVLGSGFLCYWCIFAVGARGAAKLELPIACWPTAQTVAPRTTANQNDPPPTAIKKAPRTPQTLPPSTPRANSKNNTNPHPLSANSKKSTLVCWGCVACSLLP